MNNTLNQHNTGDNMTRKQQAEVRAFHFASSFSLVSLLFLVAIALPSVHALVTDQSLTFTNTTYNDTGAYISGTKLNSRTYDTVVCRSTNILNDLVDRFTCDYTCSYTTSDCTTTIGNATADNTTVLVKQGTYYISSPLPLANNFNLIGQGYPVFTANGTEAAWTTAIGTRSGILNGVKTIPSTTPVDNVTISGIKFVMSNLASTLSLFGGDSIHFTNNIVTGQTNSTYSQGTGISFVGVFAGKDQTGLVIDGNQFINIRPVNGQNKEIYFDNRGKDVYNTRITNNVFKDINGAIIYITGSATKMINTVIDGNQFIEINDTHTLGGALSSSEAMNIGIATPVGNSTVQDLYVTNNYYRNGFTQTPNNSMAGFLFWYGVKNSVVTGNIVRMNVSLASSVNSLAFAPGRVSTPLVGVVMSQNDVDGFRQFWDPDSMTDADVSENVITDTGDIFPSLGYGTIENVHVHDNSVVNRNNPQWSNHTAGQSGVIGVYDGNQQNSIIENNVIANYMTITTNCSVYTSQAAFNHANVTIRNNNLYNPNGTVTYGVCGVSSPGLVTGNNFLVDNVNINTTGNASFANLNLSAAGSCVYLPGGGKVCGNSTCTSIYSPNALTIVQSCN